MLRPTYSAHSTTPSSLSSSFSPTSPIRSKRPRSFASRPLSGLPESLGSPRQRRNIAVESILNGHLTERIKGAFTSDRPHLLEGRTGSPASALAEVGFRPFTRYLTRRIIMSSTVRLSGEEGAHSEYSELAVSQQRRVLLNSSLCRRRRRPSSPRDYQGNQSTPPLPSHQGTSARASFDEEQSLLFRGLAEAALPGRAELVATCC